MSLNQKEINKILIDDFKYILKQKRYYHYSSFDTTINHILIENSIKFSDPTIFNDPFDCSEKVLNVNYDRKLIDSILKENSLNRNQRRNLKTKEIQQNQNSIMREKRKEFKISCFSSKNDEVLMWSHYAEKHNGICCGFDFPINYPTKFTMTPVKYLKEIKKLEGETELYKIILYWLTTKSEVWEYENEFRAIANAKLPQNEFEYINYDLKYLKEIVFGCNVKKEKIQKALKVLKSNKIPINKIEIKRTELNTENYKLKIVGL